jgi:hypothetical protein
MCVPGSVISESCSSGMTLRKMVGGRPAAPRCSWTRVMDWSSRARAARGSLRTPMAITWITTRSSNAPSPPIVTGQALLPRELFIHGKARFGDAEWSCFVSGADSTTSVVGVRIRHAEDLRVYRPGTQRFYVALPTSGTAGRPSGGHKASSRASGPTRVARSHGDCWLTYADGERRCRRFCKTSWRSRS